jgi:hypothetical protein
MNQFALRMFVRSILAEAKDKKADDKAKDKKEAPKKSAKKEPKKTSDNLVEMKKELAAKKEALSKVEEYRDNLQAAKFAKNVSGEEFAERSGFAGELNSLSQQGIDLEKEVENTITKIKDEITALEEKTITEISRIKEMMGLTSEKKDAKKIVGEKKGLNEAQVIRILKDFKLGDKDFKKGDRVGTQPDFDNIIKAKEKGTDYTIAIGGFKNESRFKKVVKK